MIFNPEKKLFSNKEKTEKEYKFNYAGDFVTSEAVLESESRDWPNGFVIVIESIRPVLFLASKEKDSAEKGLSEFNEETEQEIIEKIGNNDVLILAGPTNSGKTEVMKKLYQQYPKKYSYIDDPAYMDDKKIKNAASHEIICLTEIKKNDLKTQLNIIKFLWRNKKIILEPGGFLQSSCPMQIEDTKKYLQSFIEPFIKRQLKVDSVMFGIKPLNKKQTEEYLMHLIKQWHTEETAIVRQNIENIGKASKNTFIIFRFLQYSYQYNIEEKIFSPAEWENQIERWWKLGTLGAIMPHKLENAKEIAQAIATAKQIRGFRKI